MALSRGLLVVVQANRCLIVRGVDVVMQMAGVRPIISLDFRVEQLVTILNAAPILSRVGSRIYLEGSSTSKLSRVGMGSAQKVTKLVEAVCEDRSLTRTWFTSSTVDFFVTPDGP